jgi:hypothetical protein
MYLTAQRRICRIHSCLLMLCLAIALASCCGCLPAVGSQPSWVGTRPATIVPNSTQAGPFGGGVAFPNAEDDPFGAPAEEPAPEEPEPPPVPQPARPERSWGPEQATGPPDTTRAGDIPTAWASKTSGSQDEWLKLRYARAVVPAGIHVYETYNPGALYRVTATHPNGQEVEVWSGKDPLPVGSGKGKAAIALHADFPTNCITIYLKSTKVPGWNEIDAVGLLDMNEQIQWAVSAEASSTWASPYPAPKPVPVTPQSNLARIRQLEALVGQLRAEVQRLQQKPE